MFTNKERQEAFDALHASIDPVKNAAADLLDEYIHQIDTCRRKRERNLDTPADREKSRILREKILAQMTGKGE
jgi:hypothetical protein